MREKKVDKFFLTIVIILLVVGVASFVSASFGILARSEKTFFSVLVSQLVLGLGLGLVGMYFCYKINYKFLDNIFAHFQNETNFILVLITSFI